MHEYRKRPILYYLLVANAVVAFEVVCFFLTSPTELSYSSEFSLSHFVETKQLCQLTLRAAFKFGRRVHCALRRKIQKSPITRVPAIIRKWKVEQHLRWNYSQVTLDTAINDFNSGQFITSMKKMAAQVELYLCLSAFLCPELFSAWRLAHICPKRFYLLN